MSDAPESKSESAATAAPPEGDASATAQATEAPSESPKAEDGSAPESTAAEEPAAEEPKAEEPAAEEPKAEEPAAEEPKAEEPAAEEPKAEEPAAAEEPKAEEPAAAEEPKAEEPKAEEPKAEEPKAKAEEPKAKAEKPSAKAEGGHKKGKKPPKAAKPEVPAPAPKKEKEPVAEAKKGARIGEEEEKSAQDLLFDNLPMVVVVCVIFSLIPVWWTYNSQVSMEDSQQAWTDYGDARTKSLAEAEFGRLVGEHADTTAAPYLKISWASKLYETGEKAKVESARDLLKEVKRDYSHLDLVADLVEPQIKKIEAELASPRAHWAPPTSVGKAGTAPTSSN